MELRPIDISDAQVIVRTWHRHLKAPVGAKFALAAWQVRNRLQQHARFGFKFDKVKIRIVQAFDEQKRLERKFISRLRPAFNQVIPSPLTLGR